MKAISIYALTRNQNMECVQKLERQLNRHTEKPIARRAAGKEVPQPDEADA